MACSRAVGVGVAAWLGGQAALAQVEVPATAASAAPVQRVEVQGPGALQARRAAVGAVVVVERAELLRQGDTRIAEALRRVPGVTVVDNGSGAPEIRLAGLGGGHTQLLLDGEPVPPGFSLETLSPEAVERVEVLHAATADQSQQGIAGSINLVLRRLPRRAERSLKLSEGRQLGQAKTRVDGHVGDRGGALAWGLGLGLARESSLWPAVWRQSTTDAAGVTQQDYRTDKREAETQDSLTLTPQATWTLSPRQTLSTDHLVRVVHSRMSSADQRDSLAGTPPLYTTDLLQIGATNAQWRSHLNWALSRDDGATASLKLGLTWQRRHSGADFNGHDALGLWLKSERVDSLATDAGLTLAGRWRQPLGASHALSGGFDAEQQQRSEDRVQTDRPLPGGLPVDNLNEAYQAHIRRLAGFVQDEWDLGHGWTATPGLRWEGLQTLSEGRTLPAVSSVSSVFSPVLQALWHVPGRVDQVRLGLSRSYKPPTPRDLMPRRYVTADNTPTTPDWQGNPDLRPELSWGLDAGWDHPLGKRSQIGVNTYVKRIQNVIVDQLQVQNGEWLLVRANQGGARAWGLTVDAQWALRERWPAAPDLELRSSLGWNRSWVDAVSGPDNRLADQTPLTLTLDLDQRLAGEALAWGASYAWSAGGPQRESAARLAYATYARTLDLYAQGAPSPGIRWRLGIENLLHPDEVTGQTVDAAGRVYHLGQWLHTGTTVRLTLEHTL